MARTGGEPRRHCAQFCAHHETLPIASKCDALAGKSAVNRQLSQFVAVHRNCRKLLILHAAILGRKSLIPILFLVVAFAGTWTPVSAQAPPPKYAYVANWTDNTVSGYLRDATTGALTQITGSPWATGNAPASVAVDQTGNCVFVANFLSNNVSAYKITASTGVLTQVTGSPFPTGTAPIAVAVDFFNQLVYVANAFGDIGNLGSISAFQNSSANCTLTAVQG